MQMSISKFYWDTARFVYILFMAFFPKYNGRAECLKQKPYGP